MKQFKLMEDPPSTPCPEQGQWWFIVAVDRFEEGYILNAHEYVYESDMLYGVVASDNGVPHPEEPGVYRLSNMYLRCSTDWETGLVDDWDWSGGIVERLCGVEASE